MTPETLSDPALVRAWAIEQAVARCDSREDLVSQAYEIAAFVIGPLLEAAPKVEERAPFGRDMRTGQPYPSDPLEAFRLIQGQL